MTKAESPNECARSDSLAAYDAVFAQAFPADRWARIVALRSRRGFVEACLNFHQAISGCYLGNPRHTEAQRRTARHQLLAIAMFLHDTRDASDPRSGLTAAALQAIARRRGIASRGLVRDFLQDMKICGQFSLHRCAADKRVVLYRPTAHLIEALGQWSAAILPGLDHLFPTRWSGAHGPRDSDIDRQVRISVASRCLTGDSSLIAFPEVEHFFKRSGGWSLLMHCFATVHQWGSDPSASVAIDLDHYAVRWGTSKSALRRLLLSARAAGLLQSAPHNGRSVVLGPRLWCSVNCWMADVFEHHNDHLARWREGHSDQFSSVRNLALKKLADLS